MTTLLSGSSPRGTDVFDDDVDLARDRVLVTRAQGGDRSAFDDLYTRYFRRLYRFCLRRLHDTHEAEDVAQEAFARAWRALPSFGGDRRFYPWLSVIASHLCTDVLRRRNRSTPVAEFHQSNVASTEDGGEELMMAAVDSDMVAKAFTRLSDRHQRILQLREGSGWSYQRIADHEGVAITAVETLLWRARQALKREFAALAGADGRLGAWIGGALSLATLRKMLALPRRTLHKVAATGFKGAVVAAGSAAAASAVVIGATLSAPTSTNTGGSNSTVHRDLQGTVTSGPQPASSTGSPSGSTTGDSQPSGGSGSSGSTVPGVGISGATIPGSTVYGVTSGPLTSVPGATQLGTALQNTGDTLGPVGGILDSGLGGVLGTAGTAVNQAGKSAGNGTPVGGVLSGTGNVLGSVSSTETSGSGLLGTGLGTAGSAMITITHTVLGGG